MRWIKKKKKDVTTILNLFEMLKYQKQLSKIEIIYWFQMIHDHLKFKNNN